MKIAAVAVVLAGCAMAQTGAEPEIVKAAKSPYELARYIDSHIGFEWAPLGNLLGVDASLRPCEKLGDCSTELITVLDPLQTILVIDSSLSTEVYIRYFGSESLGWRRAGAHRAPIQNYPVRHAITRLGRKPILQVSSEGASGSDESSQVESWIDLTQTSFEPVFDFIISQGDGRSGDD